jgi:membrane protein required for beta-lactamase induction
MSGATSPRDLLQLDRIAPGSIVAALVDVFGTPVRRVAFWAAIALPMAYLPLLVGGLQGIEITLFLALLALNVVAVTIGHGYGN